MASGLPPGEFWTITPKEAGIIIEAAAARETRQLRNLQGIAYSLAELVAYAHHDPKRMPDFDKVFPDGKPKRQQTHDEILSEMRAWVLSSQAAEGA